jgi:hypothetical protein
MTWIKRNLYFVISSCVAVMLMGLSGFYLLNANSANNAALEQWNNQYTEWKHLKEADPHPGDGKVNNIKIGEEQCAQLNAILKQCQQYFVRIPAVPDTPHVSSEQFAKGLRTTINHLQAAARDASVVLPSTNYNFTFESIVHQMSFSPGSLQVLPERVGEVAALSGVLIRAKVNEIENLRRERVCKEDRDSQANANDYLDLTTVTNEFATITPYEVVFRCFSPELAAVLAGYASSSNGFIVKSINIEQAPPSVTDQSYPSPMSPVYTPAPVAVAPGYNPNPQAGIDAFRRRYGAGRYGAPGAPPPPPTAMAPAYGAVARTPTRSGPEIVIDEKRLKVTLMLNLVKLNANALASANTGGSGGPPRQRPPRQR